MATVFALQANRNGFALRDGRPDYMRTVQTFSDVAKNRTPPRAPIPFSPGRMNGKRILDALGMSDLPASGHTFVYDANFQGVTKIAWE